MGRYVDLVMGLNFFVDFLLLLGTNRLSGYPPESRRCAFGAGIGALYAGGCMMPGMGFLSNPFWRMVFLVLMGITAFGTDKSALRRGAVFLLLSMALGGISLSIGRGESVMPILCALCLWLLCRLCFPDTIGGREYLPVKLRLGERVVEATALRDTGNTLRDPITGQQVLVLCTSDGENLTGLSRQQLCDPVKTVASAPISGLRLIPYRSVGSGGLLLGVKVQEAWIGGKKREAVAAFAPEGLEKGQALAGGML